MNNIISREAILRNLTPQEVENREATFVISTEAVDSYGTVFLSSGWDFEQYRKNPLVAYAHRTWGDDPDNIIGTSEVWAENNQVLAKVRFETSETNPKAEKIWRKVQEGTLRMASIGAQVEEAHWGVAEAGENPDVLYFSRQRLLEWSIVPLGSNPDAMKRSEEAIEDVKKRFSKSDDLSSLDLLQKQIQINNNL